ncbi:hypothetical protein F-S17_0253 [Faustovirus]|nr:hypothetical protein F-S17_0253 [Faustovirus]QJX74031.1 hypothetical protein F-E9_277 [Faustovirus]
MTTELQVTCDEFVALWLRNVAAKYRDSTLREILTKPAVDLGRVLEPDDEIVVSADGVTTIEVEDIKRKWASRNRGYVYRTIDNFDEDEPGYDWETEGDFIHLLVEPDAPFRAAMIANLSNRIGKTISIIDDSEVPN